MALMMSSSSALLLSVSCASLFTVSLLILCLYFKTKTRRAKTKDATSEEDSSNDAMLVGPNSNRAKRGIRMNTDDGFYDDRGHYDLIGPDAPVVQSASMKTFSPTKGQTGALAAIRVNDAGYETLPVDEPYDDITYSTINEKSSKTKSGFQVDGNALYSLIEDVLPTTKSKNVKSAESRNYSQTRISDQNTDPFPIYSVVNKSPPPTGGVSSTFKTFSIDELENVHRKKKKKSKKKIDSGDSHEDDSAHTAKDTVIPIYSLVVRTKPQRDQNMPELTLEPENREQEGDPINGKAVNNGINSNNIKDSSKKGKTKVHKTSNEISINKKDRASSHGRETIDDDGGYEQLPDPIEGEVFVNNLGHSASEPTSRKKSGEDIKLNGYTGAQRLSLTLPASNEDPRRNTKGGRRRSRSEQEMSRESSLTSTSVKRCNSWAKCDLMQLPYQLTTEIPVLYTTAV